MESSTPSKLDFSVTVHLLVLIFLISYLDIFFPGLFHSGSNESSIRSKYLISFHSLSTNLSHFRSTCHSMSPNVVNLDTALLFKIDSLLFPRELSVFGGILYKVPDFPMASNCSAVDGRGQ